MSDERNRQTPPKEGSSAGEPARRPQTAFERFAAQLDATRRRGDVEEDRAPVSEATQPGGPLPMGPRTDVTLPRGAGVPAAGAGWVQRPATPPARPGVPVQATADRSGTAAAGGRAASEYAASASAASRSFGRPVDPRAEDLGSAPTVASRPPLRGGEDLGSAPTVASRPPLRGGEDLGSAPTVASRPPLRGGEDLGSAPTVASRPPLRGGEDLGSAPTVASRPPHRGAEDLGSAPTVASRPPHRGAEDLGSAPTVASRPDLASDPTVASSDDLQREMDAARVRQADAPAAGPLVLPGYRILRVLGQGGMGEVYLAERQSDVGVAVPCVVKTILPGSDADPRFRDLFLDEVRLVAGLRHPNLVTIMDVGQAGERLYQTIEWVEGMDASGLAKQAQRSGEGIPLKHLLYLLRETLQGLHYAHVATDPAGRSLNIVHRDISPGNILISRQGAVKLADFGVAVASTTQTEGAKEGLAGKPHYFAPELWKGGRASVQTDVYAMGVTFYELLSLKPLFGRNKSLHAVAWEIVNFDPRSLIESDLTIPEGVEHLLLRSLAPEPADRYASALEFLEDVNDYAYEFGIRLLDAHFARYIERLMQPDHAPDGRKPLFRG